MYVFIYLDKKQTVYTFNWGLVSVSGPKEIECKSYPNTGFKYVRHTITRFFSYGYGYYLMFFIPNPEKDGHKQIKLCNNFFKRGPCTPVTVRTKSDDNQVYVYFYGDKDPRPLMLCYKNEAYIPWGKEKYVSEWVRATSVDKCVCDDTGECENCDKLLEALVKVVGFLNEVNLSMRPNGTSDKGECSNSASPSDSTSTACGTTGQGSSSCTYDVHTYEGKPVQGSVQRPVDSRSVKVKVTCEAVNGKEPSPNGANGECNYKKLIHQPAGLSGVDNGDNFRLGDVTYPNGSGKKGSIEYYSNGPSNTNLSESNWWKPLLKVTAYFYDLDTKYEDPLLVELQFKNGTGAGSNDKEYYKLTKRGGSGSMTWTKDPGAIEEIGDGIDNKKLIGYLDEIRYGIRKVLKVEIDKRNKYQAMWREAVNTSGTGFTKLTNGEKQEVKVQVQVCEDGACEKLNTKGYKCVVHKISELGEDLYEIGRVAFTIPGENSKTIEIKLYKDVTGDNCQNGEKGEPIKLTYNKCMGDIYVFFYNGSSSGGVQPADVDSVPLMLWYSGYYYKPCDRDKYFEKWIKVPSLTSVGEPSKSGDGTALAAQLDIVNRALNIIELDKSNKAGTSASSYGLPGEVVGGGRSVKVDTQAFKTERVTLTKQDGPKQPSPPPTGTPAYVKLVHRTVNGFTIGDIKYGEQNFSDNGVKINGAGGVTIEVNKNGGNHKELVTKNRWNTVVAYYSSTDEQKRLPQLIVIMKTDAPVSQGETVTGSDSTPYGYYILSTKTGASGANSVNYEYKWVPVTNEQVTLDDPTDFRLLNSVVILLEQKCNGGTSYGDSQIGKAIKTAGLKSPGRVGEINRITNKTISVTTESASCLKQYGYKICKHDFTDLVDNGPVKGFKLISGLRFLIPTCDEGDYRQLILFDSGVSSGQHYLYYQNPNKKVSIFFYKEDPRPLLVCYKDTSYRPKSMSGYFYWWVKDATFTNCVCKGTGDDCDKLLTVLVKVSDFLNPLNIKYVPGDDKTIRRYNIHWFNGCRIRIKVEFTKATETFCYHKYVHSHFGTGNCKNGGTGFRLGNIEYNGECIKLNETSGTNSNCITSGLDKANPPKKYESADKVVVFYYQGDTGFKRPLLVALCENSSPNKCTVFYVLQKGDDASSTVKKYIKGTQPSIDLSDTSPGSTLATKLDDIRFTIAKHLQIIIDRIPEPKLYCPPKPPESAQINGKTVENKEYKDPFKCVERNNGPKSTSALNGSTKNDVIPASYKAKLYKSDGSPLQNGPKPDVKVTLLNCDQLTKHGYRCYEHQVKDVTNVEQIGGLKFYLWDDTKGQGGTDCGTTTTSNGCPAANSSATCRELCLYKPSSGSEAKGSSASCTATVNSESTQSTCGNAPAPGETNLEPVTTTYTTCKGNVYVYFYGEDPRPLMLCYGGSAYGPRCKEEYDCRWVCVPGVTGCGVKDGKTVCA